jgi:Flp pilus assembly protein TadG
MRLQSHQRVRDTARRKGAIMILAVMMLTIVFAFAAFTVDVGMITLTKGQIQNAADSAAHAAAYELSDAFGPGASVSDELAAARSRDVAAEMIERFRSGDLDSTPADAIRDVRLGRRSWDTSRQEWTDEWGSALTTWRRLL